MKKSVLALAAALLLVAACDSTPTGTGTGTGTGSTVDSMGRQVGTLGSVNGHDVTDRIFFATDSSVVDSEGQSALDNQAAWLKANTSVNITVEGHADERGTREYNIALGERRATAAKNYLVGQGVPAGRISTISYGKERPSVTGNDESAWSQNRRAVTVVAN